MQNSKKSPQVIFLMGPTASGKSHIALEIGQHFPVEIISVDSALIYRDMNIGTAKPDKAILEQIPHYLIDILDPTQSYSAAQFRADASTLIEAMLQRGKIPLLVGGTMLYFKALREGLDELPQANKILRQEIEKQAQHQGWPALHAELMKVDPETAKRLKSTDAQRIQRALEIYQMTGKPMSALFQKERKKHFPYNSLLIALIPSDRKLLHDRIEKRFDLMLKQGLIDEVKELRNKYELSPNLPSMRCVGYRQAWQYLEGEFDQATLRAKGIAATRQLAKRQLTWLRSIENLITFDCLTLDVGQQIQQYLFRLWPDNK